MKKIFKQKLLFTFFFAVLLLFVTRTQAQAEVITRTQVNYEYDASKGGYVVVGASEGESYITILDYIDGKPVVAIGDYAFAGNTDLKYVLLYNQYIDIGEGAFKNCTALYNISPLFNDTIEKNTFYGCTSLTYVGLSDNIKYIKAGAFAHSGLTYIYLPKNVKSLGSKALYCPNLKTITFAGSPTSIASDLVSNSSVKINAYSTSSAATWAKKKGYTLSYIDNPTSSDNNNSGNTGGTTTTTKKLSIKRAGHATVFVGEYTSGFVVKNYKTKPVYRSSNSKVVSVSSKGAVKFKKAGKATVTVKVNGKSYKYNYKVLKRTQTNVLKVVYKYYVTKKMSAKAKVIAADNFLAANVTYDMRYFKGTIPYISHTAKGAFEKGRAVCDGYTAAFNTIMKHYKIPYKKIIGKAYSFGHWGSHAWSRVKVGGKWYYVDTTWDDPIYTTSTGTRYTKHYSSKKYLLVSAKVLKKNHKW